MKKNNFFMATVFGIITLLGTNFELRSSENSSLAPYVIGGSVIVIGAGLLAGTKTATYQTYRKDQTRRAEEKEKACQKSELIKIIDAVAYASSLSIHVHAGHGLNYVNVEPVAQIKSIEELNIGHSIICRAIFVGLEQAVRDMVNVIKDNKL